MTKNITIPKLGVNVTKFRLVEWNVQEGDWVEKGQIVLIIETEKTTWSIEAEASGFLHILSIKGEKASTGKVVGIIAETEQVYKQTQKEFPTEIAGRDAAKDSSSSEPAAASSKQRVADQRAVRITLVARKLAKEQGVDISLVKGKGPGGRITRQDIEKAISEKQEAPPLPEDRFHGRRICRSEPLKGMRRSIADHMHRSLADSAQMTVIGEVDANEIVKVRKKLPNQPQTIDIKISYVDILIYVLAKTLKHHPDINCSLIDNEIITWEDINIGVAVALGEEGLIVPVVKNADAKTLIDISKIVKTLGEKAQNGKLLPDEVTGGTFTLTTIGRDGESRFQTPILNEPEAAILAVGLIEDRVVARDGEIVIRPVLPYSMTFDHRIINGYGAERFIKTFRKFIEKPELFLSD